MTRYGTMLSKDKDGNDLSTGVIKCKSSKPGATSYRPSFFHSTWGRFGIFLFLYHTYIPFHIFLGKWGYVNKEMYHNRSKLNPKIIVINKYYPTECITLLRATTLFPF